VIFTETALPGAYVIELERREDHRGFFARTWCAREFAARGLEPTVAQCSISVNWRRGTLRGMHYQVAPHEEVKVVRCARGAVHDVLLDIRPDSPTFLRHVAISLTADGGRMVYIPRGVAHGFQTLVDDTEVCYQMSEFYAPEDARGVRWNDPAFGISWPISDPIMHERDRSYPDFARLEP
jgi:dTDP-4-dehydrorhamnose 3,5-epimerase